MGVYIPYTSYDYTQMQGPAPSGFHVPLKSEWQSVYNIWTALGGGSRDGTNFGIALKLPFAGRREYTSSNTNLQGSHARYWSSSRYNENNAYFFYFYSSGIYPQSYGPRAYGFPVRCFKNSPIVPTSSWTKLYGTSIESGGIFWSSTDGLISLSGDGQTWITIADKNLGATTVWNSGDTLSETNCGKYYQWGNNYGFPFTGTIANQSTTQVDASNYGPGNYYSSDTFIKYNGRWDTTDNDNLWGGVTGVKHMSDLQNAYIGEYRVPGENTVAYYKLDGNVNDYLGNYNGTWSGTSAYKTLSSGIQVAYMPESNALSYIYSSCQVLPKTVSFRFQKENWNGDGSGAKDWIQLIGQCNSESGNWQLRFNAHNSSQYNHFKLRNSSGENSIGGLVPNFGNTNWHNIVLTLTNGDNKLYYDGSLFGTLGGNCRVGGNLYMGGNPFGQNGTSKRQLAGCMSEVILEDKARTAQEVSDYYNLTKSNYGL